MKLAASFALLLAACGSDTMMSTSTPDAPAMTQVTNVTSSPTAQT